MDGVEIMDLHERMCKHLELEDRHQADSRKARRDWISIISAVVAIGISFWAAYDAHRSADSQLA